ncbi:amino acid adenylation domain-containing protein [Streptomyces sp. NPDC088846]|uniref:amino acid adenylation domain-containing protein n=1 Tax=Streptomyces sp. NPDC088846 TaxID=3365908 RepID=UPI00382795C6
MSTAPSPQHAPALSDRQRSLLADRVGAARRAPARRIPSLPADSPAPASFAQERMWLIDRLNADTHAYNVYHALRIRGALDTAALRRALTGLTERHAVLRTALVAGETCPLQTVADPAAVTLPVVDLGELDGTARETALTDRLLQVSRAPFDLSCAQVLRAELIRMNPTEHVLVLALPHTATDGWSTTVLARDLAALYAGGDPARGEVTYRDYAAWQRQRVAQVEEAELGFWRTALADQAQVLDLPTDRARPPVSDFAGANRRRRLGTELSRRLRELATACDAGLYALLVAGVRVLLQAHSGQDRFVLASTITGRDRPELEDVVGCFINTLALGGDLSGDPSFAEAVRRERTTVLDAFAHCELPFDVLVRELAAGRDTSRNPIAQAFVQLDRGTGEGWSLPGLDVTEIAVPGDVAKFDLSFFFRDRGRALELNLEYATALFDEATADRFADRLLELLASAAARPDAPISELSLLPSAERRLLTVECNDTAAGLPGTLLPGLITARAAECGDRTAVVFGGQELDYAALEARANRLAHHLRALDVGTGDRVAVFLERGLDLPVALLAVLKAGAAYVPLNPGEPADRIELILRDAQPALVVTERSLSGQLPPATAPVLALDGLGPALDRLPATPPVDVTDPASLAYTIFTSGSTGRPKGVAVPHGALVNFLASMGREPGMNADDVLIAVTTPSFDIAALELFLPLTAGARLVIADRDTTVDGGRLRALIATSGATVLQATPATWRLLQDAPELAGLTALVGGEALTPDVAAPLVAAAGQVWNMYGPTETTIWSTVRRIRAEDLRGKGALPIGRPIANTSCHVLDRHGRPAPLGVPGELLIGGLGVAHGYHGRPGMTAERFVPDPYGPPGARLYRTGDMACRLPDGELEFLGRNDHQVKIRGYRVETGEIEARLTEHHAVGQAAVTVHEFGPGDRRLVAYLTPAPEATEDDLAPAALRAHLAGKLPAYMVPGFFMTLDRFPLTPNRKVDRKALPSPGAQPHEPGGQAPRTRQEERVAQVWTEVLGTPVRDVEADFFALGGHSLLAVHTVNRLNSELGTALDVRAVFDAPTVAALARRADAAVREPGGDAGSTVIPRAPYGAVAPPSPAQERMWFLEQMNPGSPEYHIPLELRISGPLDLASLRAALGAIVHRHEALRTRLRTTSDGGLEAVVEPAGEEFALPVEDLGGVADARARAGDLVAAEAARPFDLAADPLLRARLVRLAPDEHVLALTLHHAGADGASLDILRRELAAGYRRARQGLGPDLTPPSLRYADVAHWQRERLHSAEAAADLAYWRARLTGLEPLDTPVDRPRPPVRRTDGAAHRFVFSPAVATGVEALARRHSTTPFTVLMAAFQATVAGWAGAPDVAVATPVSNRVTDRAQELIGMFVNVLVLRADLGAGRTFDALVEGAKEQVAGALAHQHLPFETVVDELAAGRDPARPALTPVYFALDHTPEESWMLEGLDVERGPERILAARYELALGLSRSADGYRGLVEYSPVLFDAATAEEFVTRFERLLTAVIADSAHIPTGPLPPAPPSPSAPLPRTAPSGPGRPPAPGAEEAVARIWADILSVPVTDASEDFFALGGHSLLAARVRMRLQTDFGVDLPMHRFFTDTTVAALAGSVVQEIEAQVAAMSEQELVHSLEDLS